MRATYPLKNSFLLTMVMLSIQLMLGCQKAPESHSKAEAHLQLSLPIEFEDASVWMSEDGKYALSIEPYDRDETGQRFILTNAHSAPLTWFFAFPNSHIDGQENEKILYEGLLYPEESTLITFEDDWESCNYDYAVAFTDSINDKKMSEEYLVNMCN